MRVHRDLEQNHGILNIVSNIYIVISCSMKFYRQNKVDRGSVIFIYLTGE